MYEKYVRNYKDLSLVRGSRFVIFGAGSYGCKLYKRLERDVPGGVVGFCDNDLEKQGKEVYNVKIYSVEEAVKQFADACFLIVTGYPPSAYLAEMIAQLSKYIEDVRIFVVSLEDIRVQSKEQQLKNSQQYIQQLLRQKKCLERMEEIRSIKSIAYRDRCRNGGGPGRVLELQEHVLGYEWNGLQLSYHYKVENDISTSLDYALSELMGSIEFARLLSLNDEQTVYIVHDICSAFGLAVNGKNYVLVYHNQGELVYEWRNFGDIVSYEEEQLMKQIEMVSIQNAAYVCFPSRGAELFFWRSWDIEHIPQYSKGGTLYNCLVEDDLINVRELNDLKKEDDVYTILSIGQMTSAKGMDRVPAFIKDLADQTNRKIRWIVVADGSLKKEVLHRIKQVTEVNCKVSYVQFDRLPHSSVNYLFQISDAYLMLHRISIFDLSTLEAMYNNLVIMLSDIPGNREYNVNSNIIMISEEADYQKIAEQINAYKGNNREVYDKEFSVDRFRERYIDMMSLMLEKCKSFESPQPF